MEEVEANMTAFRDGAYPIDAHIMDYDVRGNYYTRVSHFHAAALTPPSRSAVVGSGLHIQ